MEDYKNKDLTIYERVNDLMKRMTLTEKIGQVNQHLYGWKCYEKTNNEINLTEYFKEHVAWGSGMGALYGTFRADPWSKVDYSNGIGIYESYRVTNQIQKYVIEHSRLGIPVLFVEECPHGHQALDSPSYPTNIGKGNTFDKELIEKMARVQATELKLKGVNLALVSTLDLVKDPRWGRSEECFGEDPKLSSEFTKSIVKGFQDDLIDDKTHFTNNRVDTSTSHIGVVLKHFIAQGEVLGGHNSGTVSLGPNDLMDTYDELIDSCRNAVGVMAAYNDIDGIPCHVNEELLTGKLRKQFGFQGLVMADGTALDRLENYYPDDSDAIEAALKAGVDLSLWDNLYTKIKQASEKKSHILGLLDEAVFRVLSIKFLLGLFDNPYIQVTKNQIDEVLKESREINRQLARESITLLKNDALLPLSKNSNLSIVGPNADSIYNLLGDYTAPQKEDVMNQSIYKVLKKAFPKLKYSLGSNIRDLKNGEELIEQSLETIQDSETIILVLGGSSGRTFDMEFLKNGAVSSKGIDMDAGENVDLASLELGGKQLDLIRTIKATGKKIVTVVIEGRPHDIEEVVALSDAALVAWYPGIEGPAAISEILAGKYNPDGKLSISYPRNSTQLPVYYYQRNAAKNDDYYDLKGSPLYSFGYGMHYNELKYNDISVTARENAVEVILDIENQSKLKTRETILIFLRYNIPGIVMQKERVIEFESFWVKPNSSRVVKINFNLDKYLSKYVSPYNVEIKVKDKIFNLSEV